LFHPLSLIIPFIVLLPNLIFIGTNKNNASVGSEIKVNPILSALEGIGRICVLVFPVFSSISVKNLYEITALIGMLLLVGIYYYGWIRYFTHNNEYKLLFSPIIGIPVPMAISPVVYFSLASIALHSPYLFAGSVVMAAGHVPISLNIYYQICNANKR
jgi:hypothetical protein